MNVFTLCADSKPYLVLQWDALDQSVEISGFEEGFLSVCGRLGVKRTGDALVLLDYFRCASVSEINKAPIWWVLFQTDMLKKLCLQTGV